MCRQICSAVFLVCLSNCIAAPTVLRAAELQRTQRVLMLSTGSRFSLGFPMLEQNAVEVLRQLRGSDLEFYSEYIDIVRFPSEQHRQIFRDYLRSKYADDPPDLIILFYASNLRVTENVLGELFPTTPVVAAGLTEEELPAGPLGRRATGIAARSDADGTLNLILRLHPDVKQLVIIGGTTEFDRQVISRVVQAARSASAKIKFELWNNKAMEQILKDAASLSPDNAIVFTRMFRDGAGRPVTSANVAQSIARVANVPMYALTDATFGTGVVGGSVIDVGALGRRAGELAHRVLNGADPKSIPVEILTQGTPIFDARALKRWGISESRLPPNSIIRFREDTFWDQYKWLIISVLAVCIIEAMLIHILLRERQSRRLAQQRLEERLQLEQLVSELSGTFINLPAEEIGAHIVEALGRVARLLKFDIVALSLFTGPGAKGRVAHLWQAEGVPEIPAGLTEQDFPWVAQELFAGRDVSIRTIDQFPAAAETDRATYERYHVRSTHNVPVILGTRVIGVLGLCTVFEERDLAPDMLEAQRLLGEVFASALARQRAETALRESESRFRNMADTAPVMIWMSGTDKLCEYFNEQWLAFTGRSLEQELGNGWAEGVHPDDLDRCIETYNSSFDARQAFTMEYRLRRLDGQYGTILDHGVPRFEDDGTFLGYIGSCMDVTQRKRAEERFRLAVEASPNAIVMINPRGEIVLVNKLTEELFGYSRDELIGKSVETLVPGRFRANHPEHRIGFFAAPQSRAMGAGRDLFARRKDGSEFQVEIGLNPIHTDEGTVVLTAIVDITERKRTEIELQRNRQELAHVARLSTMSELTASVAHELNQPLGAILSNAEAAELFLRAEPPALDDVRDILADIRKDDERAGEIIHRMRSLLRKQEVVLKPIEINGVVKDVFGLLGIEAAARRVSTSFDLGEGLPMVAADRVHVQQVIMNLVVNAFDAMAVLPESQRKLFLRSGTYDGVIQVSVSDSGPGVANNEFSKLFEPFFTTKSHGMGMGLSIARTIIEAHKGRIWAENSSNGGATFCFTLPVAKGV